jgi:hypothetical protein
MAQCKVSLNPVATQDGTLLLATSKSANQDVCFNKKLFKPTLTLNNTCARSAFLDNLELFSQPATTGLRGVSLRVARVVVSRLGRPVALENQHKQSEPEKIDAREERTVSKNELALLTLPSR